MPREKKNNEANPQINSPEELPALTVPPEPTEAVAPETTPDIPHPAAATGPRLASQPASRSKLSLWRIFVFLFKLGVFLAVLVALAAGVYFGWPIVYAQYIQPLQNNTAQVAILQTRQQESDSQLSALQTQLPALGTAQAGESQALSALATRLDAQVGTVQEHTLALANLESTQTSLQAGDLSRRAELEQQVNLLKSMELLSRARLFLYQSNFGLAKQDIQVARDLLAGMVTSPGQPFNMDLAEVVQRLDLSLARLPDFPVPASDDLDIAWQILLQGQPKESPTPLPPALSEPTFTPSPQTDTPNPTPFAPPASETTATPSVFDTPVPTPAPTATP